MELTQQRGAVQITLDRTRTVFYDMPATWNLIQKFGHKFMAALCRPATRSGEFELVSLDALAYFLWVGLQADVKQGNKEISLERVVEFIRPFNYDQLFIAVVIAATGAHATPVKPGKAEAPARPAQTSAKPKAGKTTKGPGPTKVSTSLKRSGSPTRS